MLTLGFKFSVTSPLFMQIETSVYLEIHYPIFLSVDFRPQQLQMYFMRINFSYRDNIAALQSVIPASESLG